MFDGTGKKQSIDKLLQTNPDIWSVALSNKLGRLDSGIRGIEGNNFKRVNTGEELRENLTQMK